MYRMYRQGRADISLYREALNMQAFNKESNSLFGYVVKRLLSVSESSDLLKQPWTAINSLLTKDEFMTALRDACHLWKLVYYIHNIITSGDKGVQVSSSLSDQFINAHIFLIKKLKVMGLSDFVRILEDDSWENLRMNKGEEKKRIEWG